MLKIDTFAEIEPEFIERVHAVVWCNGATVDTRGRPRTRVLHPIWEGTTGWVTTRRSSPKVKHLAANPFLSLAYIADPFKPIYVECRALWDGDFATRQRIWDLLRRTPPPLGFDPALTWGDIEDPENGLLRLTPWRSELNDFWPPPRHFCPAATVCYPTSRVVLRAAVALIREERLCHALSFLGPRGLCAASRMDVSRKVG